MTRQMGKVHEEIMILIPKISQILDCQANRVLFTVYVHHAWDFNFLTPHVCACTVRSIYQSARGEGLVKHITKKRKPVRLRK